MISNWKSVRSVRAILCAEWQSAQTGSFSFDFETKGEWTLDSNCS